MRRKGIAVILSTVLTVGLNFLPVSAAVVDKPTLTRTVDLKSSEVNAGNKVEVNQKKSVTFTQSSSFALDNPVVNDREIVFLFDTSGSLNKEPDKKDDPFDFALFSGGKNEVFNVQGDKQIVTGKVHANGTVNFKGDKYEIINEGSHENTIEYVVDAIKNGDDKDGILIPNTGSPADLSETDSFIKKPEISMPNIADDLLDQTKQQVFTRSKEFYPGDYQTTTNLMDPIFTDIQNNNQSVQVGMSDEYNEISKRSERMFKINGTLKIPDNMVLRFYGPVVITSGLEFIGKGVLVAEGDVIVKGGTIVTPSLQDADDKANTMIYSEKGNIKIDTSNTEYNGKLYAPEGEVFMSGQKFTVNGSVVAKRLNSIQGTLYVNYKTGAIDEFVDEVTTDPTPAERMKEEITNYIKDYSISGAATRVNVLKYNVNGNDSDTSLYDLAIPSQKTKLLDKISKIPLNTNDGKSNLADGLRKAYNLLNNGNVASKSIIVISGSVPNCYTLDEDGTLYKGIADITDSDKVISDSSSGDANKYAIEMGRMATKSAIVPYIINYLPQDDTLYTNVNTALKAISKGISDYKENNENVPIIKKLKQKLGGAFSLYSPNPVSGVSLSSTVDDVLTQLDNEYSARILSAKFSFTIPDGTKLLKDDKHPTGYKIPTGYDLTNTGGTTMSVEITNPVVITGTKDTSTDKVIYEIPANYLFNQKISDIKFVLLQKLGVNQESRPVIFDAGDCTVEYKIQYTGYVPSETGGTTKELITEPVKATTKVPFTVNVYNKVDPN